MESIQPNYMKEITKLFDAGVIKRGEVYLANDTIPNFLFRNNGDGRFTEIGLRAGVAVNEDGVALSSMGADFRDIDNDGQPDLFLIALSNETFPLFINREGSFWDMTFQSGLGYLTLPSGGWGAGVFDLNNDGRIDVAVSCLNDKAELLWNRSAPEYHWLRIELRGCRSNRDGIGARVRLTDKTGRVQHNHVTTSVGYASSRMKRVHFGLGAVSHVREIAVRWPSGASQTLNEVAADQRLRIEEP